MKFAIKSLAIAAALVATGAASAQTTVVALNGGPAQTVLDPAGSGRAATFQLLSGGGDLSFSNGLFATTGLPDDVGGALGALNVGKVVITGTGGVTVAEQTIENDLGEQVRFSSVASSNIASLTAFTTGPQAGSLLVVNAVGGARQVGPRISGTLTGGTADVTNLRFDIAGGRVIADLAGTKLAVGTKPAVVVSAPNTVLWTFDPVADVVGPTKINPASLLAADPLAAMQADGFTGTQVGTNAQGFGIYNVTASTTLKNLKITNATDNIVAGSNGVQFFIDSLGLLATGQDALNAVNNSLGKWGSVQSTLVFQVQEVPEPSTYALMGLGLVGISLVARRRAAK